MTSRLRWFRDDVWLVIWNGLRYPYRKKSAWINVVAWTVALATVGLVLVADLITKDYDFWMIWNVALGLGEFIMLHRSIEGLLWRHEVDKAANKS